MPAEILIDVGPCLCSCEPEGLHADRPKEEELVGHGDGGEWRAVVVAAGSSCSAIDRHKRWALQLSEAELKQKDNAKRNLLLWDNLPAGHVGSQMESVTLCAMYRFDL